MSKYAKEHYGVPSDIGRRISYNGKPGIIAADRGNYIGANFDEDKPGKILNIHPTDKGLEYLGMGKVRTRTRQQQNYLDYIDSDIDVSFGEWMGFA